MEKINVQKPKNLFYLSGFAQGFLQDKEKSCITYIGMDIKEYPRVEKSI